MITENMENKNQMIQETNAENIQIQKSNYNSLFTYLKTTTGQQSYILKERSRDGRE